MKKATIPLDRDLTGRFLPFILGILVLLASLMLTTSLMLWNGLSGWQGDLSGSLTVQIMPLDDKAPPLQERVQQAVSLLTTAPGVVSATVVSNEEMSRLLSPWLGQGALPDNLPIPAMIDVTLRPEAKIAELQESLHDIAGVRFDDHGSWLQDVQSLAQLITLAVFGLLALVIGAVTLILILLVRAGMVMHHDVVELLHLVGASDAFIAKQFQTHMVRVAGQGAILGGMLAALLVWGLAGMAGYLALVPWVALPIMPILFIILAAVTSRRTCRRLLSELP